MTARAAILKRIRLALGERTATPLAPVRLRIPERRPDRIDQFLGCLAALAAHTDVCERHEVRDRVISILKGRAAVASNAPFLQECCVTGLPGVTTGLTDREQLRELCATIPVGISSADFALADTGSLVMISSSREARLISLLPPAHLAIVPESKILSGLDELYTIVPNPAAVSSSMVLITGPSRTADIEQILVRGVHGPGELAVLVVRNA